MIRYAIALFLVAHSLVHPIMFGLSYSEKAVSDMSFDPAHSWLLGNARPLGLGASLVVAAAFLGACSGYVLRTTWWPGVLVVAALASIVLLAVYHSRYWLVGYALNLVIIVLALQVEASGPGSA